MSTLKHNRGPDDDEDGKMRWVRINVTEILEGIEGLSWEQRGYYVTALFKMYARMGGIPNADYDGARAMSCDVRFFRRLRDQLLAAGKFYVEDGLLKNKRVEKEITSYVIEHRRRQRAALEREEAKRRTAGLQRTSDRLLPDFSPNSPRSPGEVSEKSHEYLTNFSDTSRTSLPKDAEKSAVEAPEPWSAIGDEADHGSATNQEPITNNHKKRDIDSSKSRDPDPLAGKAVDRAAINRDAAKAAFAKWQDVARECGLPVPRDTTFPVVGKKIASRMYEHAAAPKGAAEMLAIWDLALANVQRSGFLRGQTHAGFRADLKFLCQRESFAKLIDGGYGNGAHAPAARNDFTAIVGREALARGPLRIRDGDGDLLAEPAQQRRRTP